MINVHNNLSCMYTITYSVRTQQVKFGFIVYAKDYCLKCMWQQYASVI